METGKTIVAYSQILGTSLIFSSSVLKSLDRKAISGVCVAAYYCDGNFQAKQDARNILGNLLQQIIQKMPDDCPALLNVSKLYEEHKADNHRTSSLEIRAKAILTQFVELLLLFSRFLKTVYLIIDGLDECESRQLILGSLREIVSASAEGNIKLFVSSRPEVDIATAFCDFQTLRMEDHVQPDIELHIDQRLTDNPRFDKDLKDAVKRKVLENSDRYDEGTDLGREW